MKTGDNLDIIYEINLTYMTPRISYKYVKKYAYK